jgi:hypothetical protein
MEVGYFTMPSHPPECGLKEGNDWDLQVLRWLDELGYQEAWVGEHHTAPWEPNPAPDLLIAQALLQTKNIRIGPGGFLLNPLVLSGSLASGDNQSRRIDVVGLSELIDPPSAPQKEAFDQVGVATHLDVGGGLDYPRRDRERERRDCSRPRVTVWVARPLTGLPVLAACRDKLAGQQGIGKGRLGGGLFLS